MERELLEAFENAKKAADAASDGGGSSDVDRCVDALRHLKRLQVTMQDLVNTQVGKRLRGLTKHPSEKIQSLASDLLVYWKNLVIEETTKKHKKNNGIVDKVPAKVEVKSDRAEAVKVEKVQKVGVTKVQRVGDLQTHQVEKMDCMEETKMQKVKSETVKVETLPAEKISRSETVEVEKVMRVDSIAPPKLTSMLKCNDNARDKTREILREALSKVYEEVIGDIRDEVKACDPIRVAVSVESIMFGKVGKYTNSNPKYKSIMFNLKDANNPDLRRRVLLGHITPEVLIKMTPEDMASDARKEENNQIKAKALFDCERGAAPKATTDQFKCGRCGQRKTTYYQLQTRSADEPMTTFVTCVNCNNHWKFC